MRDFPHEGGGQGTNEPNTLQQCAKLLRHGSREPILGVIRVPFEQIIGPISLITELETVSASRSTKPKNFHPMLISILKIAERADEENTVELIGFIVR